MKLLMSSGYHGNDDCHKICISVSTMYFQVLDCTKFHYHEMTGEKVINNQNFQISSL